MNACMSEFRIVNPTLRTFSAAEARIAHSSIRFNNLSAAELGYPEHIRLLISSDGCTLAIQACDPKDKCAVPFMAGRTADDLKGQKKWTTVSNRMLTHIIRSKLGWETAKTPRRFYGVPWPEQGAIIFDLTKIAPPRTRTPNLSAEDMLRAYELAESGSLLPVMAPAWSRQTFRSISSSSPTVCAFGYSCIISFVTISRNSKPGNTDWFIFSTPLSCSLQTIIEGFQNKSRLDFFRRRHRK